MRAMQGVKALRHKGRHTSPAGGLAPGPDTSHMLELRRRHAQGDTSAPPGRMLTRPDSMKYDAGGSTCPDPDALHYLQPGHGTDLLRGLRRGKWQPGACLDLHGYTLEQALTRLENFLQACMGQGIRCVQIIHGKGIGSRGEPVLKTAIRQYLGHLAAVQAWVQGNERLGGAGAVLVLLRPGPDATHKRKPA